MKRSIFLFLFLAFACSSKSEHHQKVVEKIEHSNGNNHTIHDEQEQVTQADAQHRMDSSKLTYIDFKEVSVGFYDVKFRNKPDPLPDEEDDTAWIEPEDEISLQGKLLTIQEKALKDIEIWEQYETSVWLIHEDSQRMLSEWKHYVSAWQKLQRVDEHTFVTRQFSEEECHRFPYFSQEELYRYMEQSPYANWAELIREADPAGPKPYKAMLSTVRFKIKGWDSGHKEVQKMIACKIAN